VDARVPVLPAPAVLSAPAAQRINYDADEAELDLCPCCHYDCCPDGCCTARGLCCGFFVFICLICLSRLASSVK
jgi:hypothetical protein